MKIRFSNPATGASKMVNIEDENLYRLFYDKRIGNDVEIDSLGSEYKGYVIRITGGQDKQGFPMKQGVLTTGRVRLLIPGSSVGLQSWRLEYTDERRRKTIRGCIVSQEIACLNTIIIKKGEKDIPGVTEEEKPRTLGPKRASLIRRLFNLTKEDDVRRYVIKHKKKLKKGDKVIEKLVGPKIQRLVTPERLHRRNRVRKEMTKRRKMNKLNKTLLEQKVKAYQASMKKSKEKKLITEQKQKEDRKKKYDEKQKIKKEKKQERKKLNKETTETQTQQQPQQPTQQ